MSTRTITRSYNLNIIRLADIPEHRKYIIPETRAPPPSPVLKTLYRTKSHDDLTSLTHKYKKID